MLIHILNLTHSTISSDCERMRKLNDFHLQHISPVTSVSAPEFKYILRIFFKNPSGFNNSTCGGHFENEFFCRAYNRCISKWIPTRKTRGGEEECGQERQRKSELIKYFSKERDRPDKPCELS